MIVMMSTSFVGELCLRLHLRLHRARSCSSVTSNFFLVYCNCGITVVCWIPRNLGNLIDDLHLLVLPSLMSSWFKLCASHVRRGCYFVRVDGLTAGSLRFFCCAQVLVTLSFLVSSLGQFSCPYQL